MIKKLMLISAISNMQPAFAPKMEKSWLESAKSGFVYSMALLSSMTVMGLIIHAQQEEDASNFVSEQTNNDYSFSAAHDSSSKSMHDYEKAGTIQYNFDDNIGLNEFSKGVLYDMDLENAWQYIDDSSLGSDITPSVNNEYLEFMKYIKSLEYEKAKYDGDSREIKDLKDIILLIHNQQKSIELKIALYTMIYRLIESGIPFSNYTNQKRIARALKFAVSNDKALYYSTPSPYFAAKNLISYLNKIIGDPINQVD